MSTTQDLPAQIAELFPPQGQWTEDDYFALPDAKRIIELSDGEIIMPPPPVPVHQQVVMRLGFALNAFARASDLGTVYLAPVAVRLWNGKIREPDVLLIRKEHSDRVLETLIDGAPDWVAEVISPGSRRTDEVHKLADYARAGIPEYWLLDSKKNSIRVYRLQNERYTLSATYRAGQSARSQTIAEFEVAVNEVFGR
jgi:Uma2 family endonuclease